MINNYLFEVPAKFAAAYQANQLSRFGGVLKDNATGQIVGHLQESGISNNVMSGFLASPLAPMNAISSLTANVQLANIKGMLELMQVFQFATMGISIAGLGVSAVGFTILNKKINAISHAVGKLDDAVENGFRAMLKARVRDAIVDLKGTIAVAEHKFALGESGREWDSLGKKFIEKSERFRSEVQAILNEDSFDEEAFDSMLGALLLSNSSACKSFLLADNLIASRHHAEVASKTYDSLFDEVTPALLASRLRGTPGSDYDGSYNAETLAVAQHRVRFIRDIQESAASLPYLMETLRDRSIPGFEYVTAIQKNTREPLLVLAA